MISSRQYWLSLEIAGVLALGILSASGIQLSTENGEVPSREETPLQRGEVFKLSSGELTEVAHDSDSAFTASPQESNNFSLALPTASSLVRINLKGPLSITLTGALGETVKMNLSHFILRGDSVLTLAGTATTTFVIRIRNRFSLSQSSKVVLADGLLPENVVFHVLGKGDAGYSKQADDPSGNGSGASPQGETQRSRHNLRPRFSQKIKTERCESDYLAAGCQSVVGLRAA